MLRTVYADGEKIRYLLVSRSGAARFSLKALPDHGVRLDVPAGTPLREADRFVLENRDFLISEWKRIDSRRRSIADGSEFSVSGRMYVIRRITGSPPGVRMEENVITITAATDEAARACLKVYLSKLALIRIREKLDAFCPYEKPYKRVTVREQRSRWGSLSRKGNLNFNWKLILAPDEALTYVVAHELAHFAEFNHSPAFYRVLGKLMPDYAPWKEWLKKNGNTLDF